ncbi:MAG: hypothetical protein A2Z03_10540, partial [Chloroflexi bacterium RBG_16_56_8]
MILIALAGLILLAILILQIPAVNSRLAWRFEVWRTYAQNVISPVGEMPTALPVTPSASLTPRPPTPTPSASATATPTPEPLPAQVSLRSPEYEVQGINNCGPATLAMALRMYGSDKDQYDIAGIIKPIPQDRNVNPDELRYYVLNETGWLRAEFRVGGNLNLLKRLLAANYAVIIEATTALDPADANGPNDDLWSAHYLLITGYDDMAGVVTAQDPLRGPDKKIRYEQLLADWKPFNYLYMLIYLPEDQEELQSILGDNWGPDQNRRNALSIAEIATVDDPNDAFAWFNLGSNLVYFDSYEEAAQAYDTARSIGLPQRMTRYQFGPFFAYFNTDRIDDLLALTEYTYRSIPNRYAEEALLWHGWGLYRKGDVAGAIA